MSTFDPIDLGEYAQESYAKYLVGSNQRGYQGLLNQFVAEGEESIEQQFIRSKGPFLEGVAPAKWSHKPWPEFARDVEGAFAPSGLEEPIIEAFREEQFEYLQVHQQDAINWLVDDKHALIAAATGRGKTEAWFIPILQYALRAKRGRIEGVPVESIKAVLTYPTKALAQDQLKRFIEYLWLVNEKADLPADQKITIGVYDGDTPYRGWVPNDTRDTFSYLIDSFEHFELPSTIAEKTAIDHQTLKTVPPNVNVTKENSGDFRLKMKQEYGGHVLDFVHLTRNKMQESPPDIMLTNPDTINYRLFNVNDEQAHRLFVDQPKFLVFDEVHTYQGLFGTHVSMLVKRLRRLREEREVEEELRLIASSATIDEREELFQRLLTIPTSERDNSYKLIEEATDDGISTDPGTLPPQLTETSLIETLTAASDGGLADGGQRSVSVADGLELSTAPDDDIESQIEAAIKEGPLSCLDHLHKVLQNPTKDEYDIDNAPRFGDFVEYLQSTYSISSEPAARRAAQNVLALFHHAGRETRIHVFNWPVDGYFKCVHCHRIYSKPVQCDCEEHEQTTPFVTKIRLCQNCGEQVYEAWYCVDCGTVRPVTQETEGEYLYATKPECNHPDHSDLVRIYWTPEYRCEDCGHVQIATEGLGYCECGGSLTRTPEGITCKDPTCTINREVEGAGCVDCGGRLSLENDLRHECSDPDCEQHADDQDGLRCDTCESPLVPKYSLPWVCTNEDHRTDAGHVKRYPPEAVPETCNGCQRSTFVLPVYVDTQSADYCRTCNKDRKSDLYYFPGTGCSKSGHDEGQIETRNKSFGLKVAYRDSARNVRLESPNKASHVLPCYHGRQRNYDSLMRSPTNAAVTMGQFMLRKLADDNDSQHAAKMMSFADSYRDMERLANDFEEPEKKLFVQQRLLEFMEREGTATLRELFEGSIQDARSYWSEIGASGDIIDTVIGYSKYRGTVLSQLVEGTYLLFNGNISHTYADLVRRGMLDISFAKPLTSPAERIVCRELLSNNRQNRQSLLETLGDSETITNPVEVLNSLKEKNVIREDEDYEQIEFAFNGLNVHLVGPDHSINYDPHRDRFVSTAWLEVSDESPDNYVGFSVPYYQRTSSDSPYFDRDAYWAAVTDTRALLSEVYKGDIPADERRGIEHEFKHDPVPNFLSTGPAMEIGIDIGDLNTLMLLGTPPNTNAYLQRIGRAGRDAGKSLVTTISKRNPIDFYYHKKPSKIISSDEKPIPLNQHNEHVLEVSLTWAIMDYITARYHIPWEKEEAIDGDSYTKPSKSDWNLFRKDEPREEPPSSYDEFNQLYYKPVNQIHHGSVFEVLTWIAREDEGVRVWLEDLLDYTYCRNCDHVFNSVVENTCDECGEETLQHAATEFDDLIDDVISKFDERLVKAAYNYRANLEQEKKDLKERINHLEEAKGGDDAFSGGGFDELDQTDEESQELEADIKRLKSQRDMVQDLINDYKKSKFANIHKRSAASAFIPNLRSFSDSVNVRRRKRDSQGKLTAESKEAWDRDASMALREMHPYAYLLRNKQGYVVTSITKDTDKTKELAEELEGEQLRCSKCGHVGPYENQTYCPNEECDAGPADLNKIEPLAIKEVDMTEASVEENDTKISDIYSLSDYSTNPRSTFGHVTTEIPDFEADRRLEITDSADQELFTIEQGGIDIVETVDSYTASYDDGRQDPAEQPLRLCMQGDCGSVVVKQGDGSTRCLSNPGHDPAEQSEVMIGRTYSTKGIRITSERYPDTVLHTFAHGLRLALQRTGGLDIRSLQESFEEGDKEAFVFESTVGGNGVTDLLFSTEDGIYAEVIDAIEVMHTNIDECDCNSGCPECVYQYGCSEDNKDRTFDKEFTTELLERVLAQEPAEALGQ